ncbi:hypothetical protein BDN72DRAFT_811874 [Pluteus cervinus]|uniref:Uncharacterized protein n=1 Tax=Pluteus cervinus TaxID=181527 RepID=A0ACD3BDF4_9AGAR|nr:hypothetical protein BDN72DRAFT_811874 [Pluteus cervinus]
MGFLKRIFSLGGKKNKKNRQPDAQQPVPRLNPVDEEDHEIVAGRLLRSSSTRFAVVAEVDYNSLPPLPHPINNVLLSPAASTASLASTTISQRGTYSVTLHERQQHTRTEFPLANRHYDEPVTPPSRRSLAPAKGKDTGHALGLRSDPSVASLLDLYDEHGRLPARAFTNSPPSPPRAERPQVQRNGSTLRQLLGNPPSLSSRGGCSALEGDISWAERFLGEADSVYSDTSAGLNTPLTSNPHLPHNPNDITVSTDHSLSTMDNPAISSMEVELSMASELASTVDIKPAPVPVREVNSKTPRRASQVFEFLTERKRAQSIPPPQPASAFSSPSSRGSLDAPRSHFSPDSSFASSEHHTKLPALHIPSACDTPKPAPTRQPARAMVASPSQIPVLHRALPKEPVDETFLAKMYEERALIPSQAPDAPRPREVRVIMTDPTTVIVTAPTPSTTLDAISPSRIPKGPRIPTRKRSSQRMRPSGGERSRSTSNKARDNSCDSLTPGPAHHKGHHRRASSQKSTSSSVAESEVLVMTQPKDKPSRSRKRESRSILSELDKENNMALKAHTILPSTPLRANSNSSNTRSRMSVGPDTFRPPSGMMPSPASSSELSPIAQEIMTNLRHQRHKSRDVERRRSTPHNENVTRIPRI